MQILILLFSIFNFVVLFMHSERVKQNTHRAQVETKIIKNLMRQILAGLDTTEQFEALRAASTDEAIEAAVILAITKHQPEELKKSIIIPDPRHRLSFSPMTSTNNGRKK